MNVAIAVNKE